MNFLEIREMAHKSAEMTGVEVKKTIEKLLREQIFDGDDLKEEVVISLCRLNRIVVEVSIDTKQDLFKRYCKMIIGKVDSALGYEVQKGVYELIPESQVDIKLIEIQEGVYTYKVKITAK